MQAALGVEADRLSFRGFKRFPDSVPKPVNLYHFTTETFCKSKNFDDHVAILREKFGDMITLNGLINGEGNSASLILYWWTTESCPFQLSQESLRLLSSIDARCDFNLAIYDE